MEIAIVILFIVGGTACPLWFYLFKHLFNLRHKLSTNIREEVYPDIHKTVNLLISLSSAAIVLTFSILQFLNQHPIKCKYFIITSWLSFTLVVIFGMVILTFLYIFRAQYKVMLQCIKKAKDDPTSETAEDAITSINSVMDKDISLHVLLYMQSISFVSGIIFLMIFAIINIGST